MYMSTPLHHVRTFFDVGGAVEVETPLRYIDAVAALSQTMGRNLDSMAEYKLCGLVMTMQEIGVTVPGPDPFTGLSINTLVEYFVTTDARVNALSRLHGEWSREQKLYGTNERKRKFRVRFDASHPTGAEYSRIQRTGSTQGVVLDNSPVSAAEIGVFQEFNAASPPRQESTLETDEGDEQDVMLYDAYASVVRDGIPMPFTYGNVQYATGDTVAPITEKNREPRQTAWQCWAPAGTYWPVMCGLLKVKLDFVSTFPIVGMTDNMTVYLDTYWCGWRAYNRGRLSRPSRR